MTELTFDAQISDLSFRLYVAKDAGDIVASQNYTSRIAALTLEQIDIANARIAELEAALNALNPKTEEAPCSPL